MVPFSWEHGATFHDTAPARVCASQPALRRQTTQKASNKPANTILINTDLPTTPKHLPHISHTPHCKGNPHFHTHYQLTTADLDSPARGRPGPVGRNASLPRTSPPAGPRPNRRPHVDAHLPDRLMYLYGLSRTLFLIRFLFGSRCSLALASH